MMQESEKSSWKEEEECQHLLLRRWWIVMLVIDLATLQVLLPSVASSPYSYHFTTCFVASFFPLSTFSQFLKFKFFCWRYFQNQMSPAGMPLPDKLLLLLFWEDHISYEKKLRLMQWSRL
jgi:hypothetical protein